MHKTNSLMPPVWLMPWAVARSAHSHLELQVSIVCYTLTSTFVLALWWNSFDKLNLYVTRINLCHFGFGFVTLSLSLLLSNLLRFFEFPIMGNVPTPKIGVLSHSSTIEKRTVLIAPIYPLQANSLNSFVLTSTFLFSIKRKFVW